ncbi:MAG: hypothetical protein SOW80_01830 [Anaerovoracaceae bacterium]|nr:hypothetical protein [Anaerovoracaceae bacterium]
MRKLVKMIKQHKKHMLIGTAVIAVIAICIGGALFLLHEEEAAEPSLEEVLEEKLTAYETDLRDSLGSMDTNTDVAGYLLSWAKNKEIPATTDDAGNVIFTVRASENAGDVPPAALVCSFDADHMENHVEEMAVALCVAKNAINHGKLSVVFLAEENGQKTGAQGFDIGHFTDDTSIFCLGNSVGSRVSTVTGGYRQIQITHKLEYQRPSYNKAYKITLKNCPSLKADGNIGTVPNPIKVLGNVLANFKSTSLLFELGTFYGGSSADFTPSKASMTVVINDSDTEKFQRKMENSIEKIYDKYHEDYPEIEYTYEEVDLPSHVLDTGDTDNLVSLMYTIFDGIYQRDDEGVITAITNIGKISCKDNLLKIQVSAMSSDQTLLDEICESYETICGLCDVKFKIKKEYPVFYGLTGRPTGTTEALLDSFEEAFKEFTGDDSMKVEDTAVLTPCTFLRQKNENLTILYCGVTEKTIHKFAGSLVTWLDQGEEEE